MNLRYSRILQTEEVVFSYEHNADICMSVEGMQDEDWSLPIRDYIGCLDLHCPLCLKH